MKYRLMKKSLEINFSSGIEIDFQTVSNGTA